MNTNIEILLDRTAEYLLKYDASEEGQKCAHEIQDYYEYRPNYILGCLDYARKFAHKAQTIDIDEDPNEFISVANKAYHAWASSMKTQNENMKKNKIRITESKLKQIVDESVKKVLNEVESDDDLDTLIANNRRKDNAYAFMTLQRLAYLIHHEMRNYVSNETPELLEIYHEMSRLVVDALEKTENKYQYTPIPSRYEFNKKH